MGKDEKNEKRTAFMKLKAASGSVWPYPAKLIRKNNMARHVACVPTRVRVRHVSDTSMTPFKTCPGSRDDNIDNANVEVNNSTLVRKRYGSICEAKSKGKTIF